MPPDPPPTDPDPPDLAALAVAYHRARLDWASHASAFERCRGKKRHPHAKESGRLAAVLGKAERAYREALCLRPEPGRYRLHLADLDGDCYGTRPERDRRGLHVEPVERREGAAV